MDNFKTKKVKDDLNQLINKSMIPTIIALFKANSFAAFCLSKIIDKVQVKYDNELNIHLLQFNSKNKLLGLNKTMTLFFIRGGHVLDKIEGSISEREFYLKLKKII